jgi:hypothetical protein
MMTSTFGTGSSISSTFPFITVKTAEIKIIVRIQHSQISIKCRKGTRKMVTGIYHQNIHLISQFPLPCLPSGNIQSVKVRTDQHIY